MEERIIKDVNNLLIQLLQKMREAGYEWNADKKELRKIEQKPAEWSIFDYRTWQYIVSDVLTKKDGIGQYLDNGECKKIAKYMQEEWSKRLSVEQRTTELPKGQDYGIDGLYAAIDILKKTLCKVDGYQTDDGILEHKCAISAVKKLYEHHSAWSEEDEKQARQIERIVHNDGCTQKLQKQIADWLKSIKDRVQPQPKQEWSEEDGRCIRYLIECLEVCVKGTAIKMLPSTAQKYIEWLKSLKPQSHWKPSDEQMRALSNAGNSFRPFEEGHKVLWSLYNDLKKLKG